MADDADKNANIPKMKAHADPTKDFFVRMITRDISLTDCVMDLIDNSIDGAYRLIRKDSGNAGSSDLAGYGVALNVDGDKVVIKDNCGGISLNDAIEYAFHFGRRKDAPKDVDQSIGLYGIGMKRAIFKMGRKASVFSTHSADSFRVDVDVDEWEDRSDWDFDIAPSDPAKEHGTEITISELYDSIAASFADPSFRNSLIKTMARDYAFVIAKGFEIMVNGTSVPIYDFKVKHGGDVRPASIEYEDSGVSIKLVAGLMRELENEIPEELRPDVTESWGWYVICNDRVVLAGDKSDMSVWGHGGFQDWHPQYNGFAGFVFLKSDDAKMLPWTTTKRDIDTDDPLYLRARTKMKEITKQFIAYTNARKNDPEGAREKEKVAQSTSVTVLRETQTAMSFPTVEAKPKVEKVTIAYQKPKSEVKAIATAMGSPHLSAREVGKRTFDYFKKLEIE